MFNNPKTANSFGINSSEGKQKALFLVLERGREANRMMRYQGLAKCLRQTTNS